MLTDRAVIERVDGGAEVGDGARQILFYPNGSTSGADVVVASRRDRSSNRLRISLDPLIGTRATWTTPSHERRARAGGFTLLEIAVALAILGIGMVACMQVFSGGLRLQDRASRQNRAVMLARATRWTTLIEPPKKGEAREHRQAGLPR